MRSSERGIRLDTALAPEEKKVTAIENNDAALDAALADEDYFVRAAEASLFAYGGALPFDKLAEAIGCTPRDIPRIIKAMQPRYADSALEVLMLDGSAQIVTKNEYAEVVRHTLEIRRNQPLSRAALEVLSIIAYNQPATRALVDKVRGVESPSVILSLCDKGLIEEKGRLDAPGRPMLYGTTPLFLRTFGLEHIDDLNQVPELADFTRQITEQKEALLIADKEETIPLDAPAAVAEITVEEPKRTVTEADSHADEELTEAEAPVNEDENNG